jgi:hypothetical protein
MRLAKKGISKGLAPLLHAVKSKEIRHDEV